MAQGSKSSLQAAFLQEMEKARATNFECNQPYTSPAKVKPKTTQIQHVYSNGSVDKYRTKYVRLKKLIKRMIFLNAALCDEVSKAEEQVSKVRDQRRFLLRRLQDYQALPEMVSISSSPSSHTVVSSAQSTAVKTPAVLTPGLADIKIEGEKSKGRKKINPGKKKEKKESVPVLAGDTTKPKQKKAKSSSGKRHVLPIPLDNTGRPIFPIELGPLTIHSLGEITCDRAGYHTTENIYPIGFCSTRTYASLRNPSQKCLYTCKILDSGTCPKFEISPEDAPDRVFSSDSPDDSHRQLLTIIYTSRGVDPVDIPAAKGAEFFGISHPTVQNLIQCCPGARKCSSYKWVKFEVCRGEMTESAASFHDDSQVINFDALQRSQLFQECMDFQEPGQQQMTTVLEPSSSLRSLLTSGPLIPASHT